MNTRIKVSLVTIALIAAAVGCGSDDDPTGPSASFSIVGTWTLTSVAGVDPEESTTWTFRSNGTYSWVATAEVLTLTDEGSYQLSGSTLTVADDGVLELVNGSAQISLTISSDGNTISYASLDGARWIYERTP